MEAAESLVWQHQSLVAGSFLGKGPELEKEKYAELQGSYSRIN
jgi:hypothetical protein